MRDSLSSMTPPPVMSLPVDVVLNAQQVVGHSLQRELMQERWHRIKATIQNEQLSTRLVWTLQASEQMFAAHHSDPVNWILIILLTTDFGYPHYFLTLKT